MRLGVDASPTLFVNNSAIDGDIAADRLARRYCSEGGRGASCDSLPACFDDSDCRMPGKLGRCRTAGGKAACEFVDDARFTLTVLTDPRAFSHPEDGFLSTTAAMFPGARIDTVDIRSARGEELLRRYRPERLPWYLFSSEITGAANYAALRNHLVEAPGGLVFGESMTDGNVIVDRQATPGTVEVFVDPYFDGAGDVLRTLLEIAQTDTAVRILPLLYTDPSGGAPPPVSLVRQEEALRWLVLDKIYGRTRLLAYLRLYADAPGSSSWHTRLKRIVVSQRRFEAHLAREQELLRDQWTRVSTLRIREPVEVLIGNRELVTIKNRTQLATLVAAERRSRPAANAGAR